MASCFWFERHWVADAFCFALLKAGNSIPARIAMIAMTTRSSMRVKPVRRREYELGRIFDAEYLPRTIPTVKARIHFEAAGRSSPRPSERGPPGRFARERRTAVEPHRGGHRGGEAGGTPALQPVPPEANRR